MKVYVVTKNKLDELTTTVVGVFSSHDKAAKAAEALVEKKTKSFNNGVTALLYGTWGEVEEHELED